MAGRGMVGGSLVVGRGKERWWQGEDNSRERHVGEKLVTRRGEGRQQQRGMIGGRQ